jgi:hypothetical protein
MNNAAIASQLDELLDVDREYLDRANAGAPPGSHP